MKPLGPERLETSAFALQGGVDTISAQLVIDPGALIDGENFEIPSEGGYRRVYGYERYDGRSSPSQASLSILFSTVAFTGLAVGNTVYGVTSTATGTVSLRDNGSTFAGVYFIVVTNLVGTFTPGETLKLTNAGGVTVGNNSGTTPAAWTGINDNVASAAAANTLRALIGVVPGSGAILGVWVYTPIGGATGVYAFRNNVGGTATVMYQATAAGWVAVVLPLQVSYTAGNAAMGTLQATTEAGGTGTLTQGGVTATVKRITLESGSFTGGTAAGRLIITGVAGGNFAAGAATATGGATMTLSGVQTQITLAPSGRYVFQNYAFAGSTNSFRMYGCDGKNNAFEFDGTNYVPVKTGMATDTPSFIHVHQHYLFLVFSASVQFSAAGNPHAWSPILGAGEIDLGYPCTSLVRGIGNEVTGGLLMFTLNISYAMYGTSPSNWYIVPVAPEAGAQQYSAQNVVSPIFLDKLGITTLTQTIAYGNYEQSIISERVKKFVSARLGLSTCATVIRTDNQYRLFFSDGTAVMLTFRGTQVVGSMIWISPNVFNVACETTDLGGAIFAGDMTTGYVYQLNVGRSFDGVAINAFARLAYNHCKSPLIEKHFKRVSFDVLLLGAVQVQIGYNTSQNAFGSDTGAAQQITVNGGPTSWDVAIWDSFYWDADSYNRVTSSIDCDGTDISLLVSSVSDNQLPFSLQACLLEYSKRRPRRDHY